MLKEMISTTAMHAHILSIYLLYSTLSYYTTSFVIENKKQNVIFLGGDIMIKMNIIIKYQKTEAFRYPIIITICILTLLLVFSYFPMCCSFDCLPYSHVKEVQKIELVSFHKAYV